MVGKHATTWPKRSTSANWHIGAAEYGTTIPVSESGTQSSPSWLVAEYEFGFGEWRQDVRFVYLP